MAAATPGFGNGFVTRHYGLGHAVVSGLTLLIGAGALAGVLTGGRLADGLIRRGHPGARVLVPAVANLLAVGMFLPGLLTTSVAIAVPVFVVAAASLTAGIPPLDAARLDIVHARLGLRLPHHAVPTAVNAAILFRALRTYPRDVATAAESERVTRRS